MTTTVRGERMDHATMSATSHDGMAHTGDFATWVIEGQGRHKRFAFRLHR